MVYADGAAPFLIDGPVERFVGAGEVGGAGGNCAGVEPAGVGERLADADSFEAVVGVAWVGDGGEASLGADAFEVGPAPREEGAEKGRRIAAFAGMTRDARPRPHAGEAADAGAAVEAHQQGFGLVVCVVAGHDRVETALARPG